MPSGLIGQGIGSSPDALFGLWMADTASGAILTSASATEIGLGLALDGASNGYWSLVLNPVLPVAPGGGDPAEVVGVAAAVAVAVAPRPPSTQPLAVPVLGCWPAPSVCSTSCVSAWACSPWRRTTR